MPRTVKHSFLTVSLALCLGLGTASAAENQDTGAIEEIVVTAQKREQSLQEIPLAVSVIDSETLREDAVSDLGDISDRTPGLVFSPYSSAQPEIAIRGIGTKEDGAAANDSTVISVDDVYIASRSAQIFDLFDLERIEVLRGPQGTLYGKNSVGGSINFVTSKPTEELSGRITLTSGNYGQLDFGALVSGPITDNFLSKLSVVKRDNDGYFDNVFTGSDEGAIDSFAARWQNLWTPNDEVVVTFTADFSEDDSENHSRQPLGIATDNSNPQLVAREFGDPTDDPFISTSDEPGYFKREITGFSTKVEVNFDTVTFTSITAWRESEFDWLFDLNGVPGGPGGGNLPEEGFSGDASNLVAEDTRQITQEFRLASDASDNIVWLAGLFFSKETIERDEKVCFRNCGLDLVVGPLPTAPAAGLIINGSDQTNDATAWALYGQVEWQINEVSNLTAGLRYSNEEKDVDIAGARDLGIVDFGIVMSPTGTPARWRVTDSSDWDNISLRLAYDYQLTDSALVYAALSTGFKSGGYTGTASTAERALNPFDEEKATNLEIGIKSQWLDNRLQLNVTAFNTDYEDLQVTRFFIPVTTPLNTIGEFVTENAAEATIQGLEVEWLWRLTANVDFGGNLALLDAEFDDFTPETANLGIDTDIDGFADACPSGTTAGSVVDGQQGCIPVFSGNKLRQAPEFSASAYLRYQRTTEFGSWSFKTIYRFQDKMYFDPDNNALTTTPNYEVWDIRLAWTSLNEQIEVALWSKNVTDEEYRTQIYSTTNGTRAYYNPGAPQTYGVTVSLEL